MEKKIPTVKVEFTGLEEKRDVEVYKWLTQDEENEYNIIISEGQDFERNQDGDFQFKVYPSTLVKANKFLFDCLVLDVKWEDFNCWPPSDREQLLDKLGEIKGQSDKKK